MLNMRLFLELPDGSGDLNRKLDERIIDAIEALVGGAVISRTSMRHRQFVVVEQVAKTDDGMRALAREYRQRFRQDQAVLVTMPCTVEKL